MTNLTYILNLDPNKLENMELAWDYKNGFIINTQNGEVVGEILYIDPTTGFENQLEDEIKFSHYNFMLTKIRLTSAQRLAWRRAWLYLKSHGYDIDPVLLAKIIRRIYESKRGASPNAKIASATALSLRISGYTMNIKQVCQEFELDDKECNEVFEIIRELVKDGMPLPAENRYIKIMNMIQQFPDKEVATVAMRLLKYAKIDGRSSASVVATLVYIADLLLNRDITMKSIAEFYKISEASIRNNYKGKIMPVSVTLTKANVAEAIYIPKKICKDLEDFKLSPKVVCV